MLGLKNGILIILIVAAISSVGISYAISYSENVIINNPYKLGIGTSNPNAPLHVNPGTNQDLYVRGSVSLLTGMTIDSVNDANSANLPLEIRATSVILPVTTNVGIGTAVPKSVLDVGGGLAVGSYAGANAAPSNGAIISGNVGIGTNSPITQSLLTTAGSISILGGDGSLGAGGNRGFIDYASAQGLRIGTLNGGGPAVQGIAFYANGGQAMTLNQAGYFGIGTSPNAFFHVHPGQNQNFYVRSHQTITSGLTIDSVNDANNANLPLEIRASQVILPATTGFGIGTSSPAQMLEVNGDIQSDGNIHLSGPSQSKIVSPNNICIGAC